MSFVEKKIIRVLQIKIYIFCENFFVAVENNFFVAVEISKADNDAVDVKVLYAKFMIIGVLAKISGTCSPCVIEFVDTKAHWIFV